MGTLFLKPDEYINNPLAAREFLEDRYGDNTKKKLFGIIPIKNDLDRLIRDIDRLRTRHSDRSTIVKFPYMTIMFDDHPTKNLFGTGRIYCMVINAVGADKPKIFVTPAEFYAWVLTKYWR